MVGRIFGKRGLSSTLWTCLLNRADGFCFMLGQVEESSEAYHVVLLRSPLDRSVATDEADGEDKPYHSLSLAITFACWDLKSIVGVYMHL